MLRRMISILAVLSILFALLPAGAAGDYPFVAYTTVRLQLRQGPSESSVILTTIEKGEAVIVNGETNGYYIISYEGRQGYSAAGYFTTESELDMESVEELTEEYLTMENGFRGLAVRSLQDALKELGYYKGETDGAYTQAVFEAVSAFQNANGLTISGIANPGTQKKLYEERVVDAAGRKTRVTWTAPLKTAEIKSGARGEAVRVLQSRLTDLGYYTGTITDTCTGAVVTAIKNFQKQNKLYMDGKAGAKTLTLLYSDSALTADGTYYVNVTAAPASRAEGPAASYPYQTTTRADVNLRKGMGTDTDRILTIPQGAEITVIAMTGDYLQVSYNKKTGYVAAMYVNVPLAYRMAGAAGEEGYRVLSEGDSGPEVKALQSALTELGFYRGTIDSKFGSSTQKAVAAFQTRNGLDSTGSADAETQTLLYEGEPKNNRGVKMTVRTLSPIGKGIMRLNSTGEAVRTLQEKLTALGYYKGNPGEVYDQETQDAVVRFQRDNNLTADGIAGDLTLNTLNAVYNRMLARTAVTAAPAEVTTPTPGAVYTLIVPAATEITAGNVIVVTHGMEGTVVRALQARLVELGYYHIEPDGVYDEDDEAAVRAFQTVNGLDVDGIAGLATQNLMFSAIAIPANGTPTPGPAPQAPTEVPTTMPYRYAVLRLGSKGEEVTALQTRLKELGYLSGAADGVFGETTENAVKLFQRANGITPDGIVGRTTLETVYSFTAKARVTAAPTATPRPAEIRTQPPAAYRTVVPTAAPRLTATPAPGVNPGARARTAVPNRGTATPAPARAATAVPTPRPTAAPAATPAATTIILRTKTPTNRPTASPKPTATPKVTATPKPTRTPKPTATPKPTNTPKPTAPPKPTATPKRVATPKPTPRVSPTPKLTGVLRRGNSGDQVTLLQKRLKELGYMTQTADGIFGSATEKALISFQNINGLTPDGVAGARTLEKIYADTAIAYRPAAPAAASPSAAAASVSPGPATILPTVQATIPVITLAPDAGEKTAENQADPSAMIPTAGQVNNVNWYTVIRPKAKAYPDVTIYDPLTGTRYRLHLFSFGKHADGETPSAVDTALMYQVCGTNSWTPHAVWVIFDDGTVYLASTHSHGHEVDHTAGNNLDGHVCLHFPRLMNEAEDTGPYAVSHQKAILAEWERIQSLLKTSAN